MASHSKKSRKSKSRARQQRLAQSRRHPLDFQTLESRNLLAAIVVSNPSDVVSLTADTSSITSLIANDGGDGISLREAVAATNNTVGEDTITFSGLFFGSHNPIRLTQGELLITESLVIQGPPAGRLVVISGDAAGDDIHNPDLLDVTDVEASFGGVAGAQDDLLDDNSRVLNFSDPTGDLTLSSVIITGGRTTNASEGGGGIIFNSNGTLRLNRNFVAGNSTLGMSSQGGGIYTREGDVYSDSGFYALGNSTAGDDSDGGGVFARYGRLRLVDSVIRDNSTTGDFSGGGGIYSGSGNVFLSNITVSGNSTSGYRSEGGGIHTKTASALLSVFYSTVSGNSTAGEVSSGGGIFSGSGGISIYSSTVSGNSTTSNGSSRGGGIGAVGADVRINNSTVTENSSSSVGGGISFLETESPFARDNQSLSLNSSIVAGNTDNGTAPDLLPPRNFPNGLDVEHSLIGDTTGSGVTPTTGTGNILGQPALLGPLADNGGRTQTHTLLVGSPAIDAGSPGFNRNDQRGGPFSVNFDDPQTPGTGTDIGALEVHSLLVDDASDEDDGDVSVGELSLREAIRLTNGDRALDTIRFDPSVFTGGANNVIRLTQGELASTESLFIDAASVGGIVITGDANGDDVTVGGTHITDVSASFGGVEGGADDLLDDNSRVLSSTPSRQGNLTLSDVTITGGRTTSDGDTGGGIHFNSYGTLTLNQSTVSGNSTAGFSGHGGGLFSSKGIISLSDSSISGNSTSGDSSHGGGIFAGGSQGFLVMSLINSTVSGNTTTGLNSDGGGIYTYNASYSGATTITNSTISENTSSGRGGGIFKAAGLAVIQNSTITKNQATIGGGVLSSSFADRTEVSSSIIAGNVATEDGNDVSGSYSFVSLGSNLIGDGQFQGSDLFTNDNLGDIVGTTNSPIDPLLGALVNNGGPTKTHRLLIGSPAIGNGSNTLADALLTDQRGESRIADGTVDIGAYELQSLTIGPKVTSVVRDEGGVLVRPDLLSTFAVTFDQDVNVSAGDLAIGNDTLGVSLNTSSVIFNYDATLLTATWDFASLPELEASFYTFELSDTITGLVGGLTLDGDGDGTAGGNFNESVYVAIPGDANLDGDVEVNEINIFLGTNTGDGATVLSNLDRAGTFTWSEGDFNGDGDVDSSQLNLFTGEQNGDYAIFLANLGRNVRPGTSQAVTTEPVISQPLMAQSVVSESIATATATTAVQVTSEEQMAIGVDVQTFTSAAIEPATPIQLVPLASEKLVSLLPEIQPLLSGAQATVDVLREDNEPLTFFDAASLLAPVSEESPLELQDANELLDGLFSENINAFQNGTADDTDETATDAFHRRFWFGILRKISSILRYSVFVALQWDQLIW